MNYINWNISDNHYFKVEYVQFLKENKGKFKISSLIWERKQLLIQVLQSIIRLVSSEFSISYITIIFESQQISSISFNGFHFIWYWYYKLKIILFKKW